MEPINFISKVQYTERGSFYCEERGCNYSGICRCYKIEEIIVDPNNISEIGKTIISSLETLSETEKLRENSLKEILFDYDHKLLSFYTMDRILRINKIWNNESWYAEWESGFYGDEVNFLTIKEDILNKIIEEYDVINNIWDLSEKIKLLLKLENGFLLKNLTNKKCKIKEVQLEDLVFGQKNHLYKVIQENNEHYLDRNYPKELPKGVCILENKKWRIIDGYHRLSTTNNKTVKIFGFE